MFNINTYLKVVKSDKIICLKLPLGLVQQCVLVIENLGTRFLGSTLELFNATYFKYGT
jgi:hypothetical protein